MYIYYHSIPHSNSVFTFCIDHNWYDVLGGAVIGICTALVAFRQTFASVFDFRFNHMLLPRATSLFLRKPMSSTKPYFSYNMPQEYTGAGLPFTREGGWGQEAYTGAPGDATALGTSGGVRGDAGQRGDLGQENVNVV